MAIELRSSVSAELRPDPFGHEDAISFHIALSSALKIRGKIFAGVHLDVCWGDEVISVKPGKYSLRLQNDANETEADKVDTG